MALQINSSFEDMLVEVEHRACLGSMHEFLISFWDIIVAEEFVDSKHIKYVCDELQVLGEAIFKREKKPHDLVVNVPPGSTKTTIVLQAFPAWLWARDPRVRVISSSHNQTLSEKSSSKSKDIIESTKYKTLFPDVKLRTDSAAKGRYSTTKGGNRHTTSTTGSSTGDHAHIKLMDDLQDIARAGSEPDREAAVRHMKSLFTREVEKGQSINVLIMQRLHERDCAAYLLNLKGKRRVKHICLPATISDRVSPPEAREIYTNGLLDPIRMSQEALDEKREELGTYDYTLQFDQNATPPEGGMIKRAWFKTIPAEQSYMGHLPTQFFIDTAYEKRKKKKAKGETANDPSGLYACYVRQGVCYILDYREVYLEITDLMRFIKEWAAEMGYKSNGSILRIEPKASGKSTRQVMMEFTKLNVKEIEGRKDSKETELRNSAPAIESGRFVLVEGIWNKLFIDRICGFPNAAHDEAVDLLCYSRKEFFNEIHPAKKKQMRAKIADSLK